LQFDNSFPFCALHTLVANRSLEIWSNAPIFIALHTLHKNMGDGGHSPKLQSHNSFRFRRLRFFVRRGISRPQFLFLATNTFFASPLPRYPFPMPDSANPAPRTADSGLCATCLHARTIESAKGSQFLLCQRSATDPAYPKYPRLPVLSCPGYEPKDTPRGDS
jgi:hypothetical protein